MTETDTPTDPDIWVLALTADGEDDYSDDRGVREALAIRYERTRLSADQLRENLGSFLDSLSHVVERIPDTMGGFGIDSVTLSAEINAKGTVSLVGTGGEIGAKGGLTITLRRRG